MSLNYNVSCRQARSLPSHPTRIGDLQHNLSPLTYTTSRQGFFFCVCFSFVTKRKISPLQTLRLHRDSSFAAYPFQGFFVFLPQRTLFLIYRKSPSEGCGGPPWTTNRFTKVHTRKEDYFPLFLPTVIIHCGLCLSVSATISSALESTGWLVQRCTVLRVAPNVA